MKKTFGFTFWVGLLGLFFTAPLLAVPKWEEVRLSVVPGVGIEQLKLGQPLPEKWPDKLGAPDYEFDFHDTGERYRRLAWGSVKKGNLEKGIAVLALGEGEESAIIDLEIRGVRAGVEGQDLFLGLPEANISKRSELVQKDGKKSYLLPGLTIETANAKMVALRVQSEATTRWRFQHWRIRPGIAVGPVYLGKPIDESLFQTIGEPHRTDRESLRWQAEDSDQSLQVLLDPRDKKVIRIKGTGLPWRTPNGVTLGDTVQQFSSKHSEAKSQLGREVDETLLKLPGLRAVFRKDKLTGFDVYPLTSER